ncbi:MAG: MEKHLA domain-containing protein [Vulcanococcus sp.]
MPPADLRRRLRRDAGSGPTPHEQAPAPSPEPSDGRPTAAWLTPAAQAIARRIVAGHAAGFGTPLLAAVEPDHLAQELFALDTVVMAHDGADPAGDPGPRLIYANAAALRLWRRPWREQIGLPSRLTAEPQERPGRAHMLVNALEQHAIRGYNGIRIDSTGRRFQLRNARLWTLRDDNGTPCGQAAAFSDWWWL